MYEEDVKPLTATGTRSIDHRIRALGRIVDKVELYARHMKEFIDTEKDSKTKATMKKGLKKVLDDQIHLRSAFLNDLLTPP